MCRVGQLLIWAHVIPIFRRVSGILTHEPIHRWSCKLRSARGWRSTEHAHVTSCPPLIGCWRSRDLMPSSGSLHCLSGPLGTLLTCRTLGHFYHLTFWVTCCIMNCRLWTDEEYLDAGSLNYKIFTTDFLTRMLVNPTLLDSN